MGSSYTLSYDVEGRLVGVSGGASASFVYDGDGRRVKTTFGTTTTVYIGDYYEQTGSTVKKYYYANGQRVAMRVGSSTVYYLLTDHLGSTAITANSSGTRVAELRYKAWGETRYTYSTTPTTYHFTEQREDATIGLYYYGQPGGYGRFYEPALGRWTQPDAIVPEPGNPQALNRYSYVYNNPVRHTDPSGHAVPPGTIRQWEVPLPSWTQSGPMRWALSVGCFFLSCHVDVERGVLKGPTPEEQITTVIQPMPMSVAGSVAGNIADEVVDDIMRAGAKKVEQQVLPGFEDLVRKIDDLPLQEHHFITNKSKRWTRQMEQITQKYGLNLDQPWNTEVVPQLGRHPDAYHEWVLQQLYRIDELAKGNRQRFLERVLKVMLCCTFTSKWPDPARDVGA